MKQFISFSGGVESSTMCVLFGNKADAIFADTGFEHEEIYGRIELIENWGKSFHRKNFKIHKVKNEQYESLPVYIKEAKFYPSFQSRYCTRMFKIEPIDNFLRQYETEGAELMIGLNIDEEDQRIGNHGNLQFITYSYPLMDNGISRNVCKVILEKAGLLPKFPVFMKRGGCIGCYFKSKKEYTAMAMLKPAIFKIVEDLENDIQDKREGFFSVKQGISMRQIREDALSSLFKPEEIYPVTNDVTKCGVFCHR